MANRQTSKELSTKYKAIDQKQLSEQAKETLKKLRLATKNFIGNDEEANDAFRAFYNKLLEKKPIAVKTSKEYKEMIRAKRRETGTKNFKRTPKSSGTSTTTKKAPKEAPKGAGTDEDAHRPAKPFGWRLRGRKNYRKPTLSEIRSGKAYYEGRVNRADVKRKKYPMLERGGYMAKGGEVRSQKEFNKLVEEKEKLVKNLSPKEVAEMWNNNSSGFSKMTEDEARLSNSKMYLADLLVEKELNEEEYNTYFSKGGYMAKGGQLKNATYVSNRNIKELQLVIKGELKKVKGSDILDGVYLKNKSTKTIVNNDSAESVLDLLNEIKKEYDENELGIDKSDVQNLLDLGFLKNDIVNIYRGYEAKSVNADTEFGNITTGLKDYTIQSRKDKIGEIINNAKQGMFEIGLKYPTFNWNSIINKYKISLTPIIVEKKNFRGDLKKYGVYLGDGIAIGHLLYENDPFDFKEAKGFNNGYWGIVVRDKKNIYSIIDTLLAQKDGYVKEIDIFFNSLGGIGVDEVKDEKFAKGGKLSSMREIYIEEIKSNTGVRQNAIENFADENQLNDSDLLKLVVGLGRKQIKPMDFSTAISGEKNNLEYKKIVSFIKSDKAFTGKSDKLNYINKRDISNIIIKYDDKQYLVPNEYLITGVYKFEDGGKLSDGHVYIPKRDVVKVTLKDGSSPKSSLNGVWVKKNYFYVSNNPKVVNTENRRVLKFSDNVLYKGKMYEFVKRNGDVGFTRDDGGRSLDGIFISLRKFSQSDLDENLTDMYGRKLDIPPYDELVKMPYGFDKGGKLDVLYSVWVRKGASDDEEIYQKGLTKLQAKKLMDKLFDENSFYEIGMTSDSYGNGGEVFYKETHKND